MDREIVLMKARKNQIFQVHYKRVLDMLLFLPFDQNEVKLLLNNLNHQKLNKFSISGLSCAFSRRINKAVNLEKSSPFLTS